MKKKFVSIFLAVTLILSNLGGFTFAGEISTFQDLPDDWSKVGLENAVKNGLLQGYNGQISPKKLVTRAELAAIVVNAMGAEKKSSIVHLSDIDTDAWYTDAVEKALQLNVFRITENEFEPLAYITREEVFYVIANLLKSQNADSSILSRFSDADQLSDWSKDAVSVLVDQGILTGNDKLELSPQSPITRAELAALLNKFASVYIREDGTYKGSHTGSVVVTAKDVKLSDMNITGNLIIADGVGDGDVSLENVTVEGELIIRGGGENTVRIFGLSNVKKVIIAKVDGVVRVLTEDGVVLSSVYLDGKDDVILEGNFGDIEIQSSDVKVLFYNATANNINVSVPDVNLDVKNAQINSLSVGENATNSNVTLSIAEVGSVDVVASNTSLSSDNQTKVNEITVGGNDAKITGEGKIEKVFVNANDASVDTKGTLITVSQESTGTKSGNTTIAAGTSSSTPTTIPATPTQPTTPDSPAPTEPSSPSPTEPTTEPTTTTPGTEVAYTINNHARLDTTHLASIYFMVNDTIQENIFHPEKVAIQTTQAIYHLTGTYEKTLDATIAKGTYRINYSTNPDFPYTSIHIYLTDADKDAIINLEGKDLYDASRKITDAPTNKLILGAGWTTNALASEVTTFSQVPYAFGITGYSGNPYSNPLFNQYSTLGRSGHGYMSQYTNNQVFDIGIIQQATFITLNLVYSSDPANATNVPTRVYYREVPENAFELGILNFDLNSTPYISVTDDNWVNNSLIVKTAEIVGDFSVGSTLSLLTDGQVPGPWFYYQWFVDDFHVSNASTYTLQPSDVNKTIRVVLHSKSPSPYNFYGVNTERNDW